MKTIGLVACSRTKNAGFHPASELYNSPLFRLSKSWVQNNCKDGWYILSAKHHLIHPDLMLHSYDCALKDLTVPQKTEWVLATSEQLRALQPCNFVVLAGEHYCRALKGLAYENPLKGMPIGLRLRWLKQNL